VETATPAASRSMIATLQDPATYGRSPFHDRTPPTGPIELCETHISWVALAGPFAYKVKKPVRYDFLDYGSLERRHAACLVELELNGRWAPGLYLGLSRLVRSDGGLFFDADGERVEYAVRMRRFSRDDELDRLIARRAVTAADLALLGTFMADQHERAPQAHDDHRYPAALQRAARQNLDMLRAARPSDALQVLSDWTERTWTGLEARLRSRRAAGRVRECHGDLHCGNVVRFGGRLVPFDGIDFDPQLRFIDVASDIAFLVMDLEARGRPDLAMSCLSAWLERSGDYDAGPCLRFLLVYRALVRAKVAALRARQLTADEADAAMRESDGYVRYAERAATRRCGSLVLMHGYSGSGKSTLAAELLPARAAVRIRADVVRKLVAPAASGTARASGLNEGLYTPVHTARTDEQLAAAARGLLQSGLNVIVDATFLDPRRREPFIVLGRTIGAPVVIVSCEASPDVLRARVAARSNDASEATPAVLEQQLATGVTLGNSPGVPVVTVRTDVPLSVSGVCAALEAALGAGTDPRGGTPGPVTGDEGQ
jgi:aminoglycoside phosphotransferase family enzyme/predicted kinase